MSWQLWTPLYLSIKVSFTATLIVGLLGIPLALLLARRQFWGKRLLDLVLTLPIVLPPTVVGYLLIVVLGRRGLLGRYLYDWFGVSLAFTWEAAVVASCVVAMPLMIKSARAAFEATDPHLELVSYTLGKSRLYTFLHITMPLSKLGLLAGLVLAFARAMGEFGATIMFAGNIPGETATMPLEIFSAHTAGDNRSAALLVVIHTAVALLMLSGVQRWESRPWWSRR